MRDVSPDHNHADGLHAPPVARRPRRPRNLLNELNEAAQNNNNNNNTHQNQNDHTVRDEDRPDHDPNQARGGGKDVNRGSEPVQPELKF